MIPSGAPIVTAAEMRAAEQAVFASGVAQDTLMEQAGAAVARETARFAMIPTPVSASPARIARWIGAAPRQRGRSEPWTLRHPRRGASSTDLGRINP